MPGRRPHVLRAAGTTTGTPGAAPVASFTPSIDVGTVPLTVNFIDTSTNTPTSWSWNFGGAEGTSTSQNPSHTYSVAGSYTVSLTATNAWGSSASYTWTITPQAAGSKPVAAYTYTKSGRAVTVTDTSTNTPTSWDWNWGDGTTHATTQNASHTYAADGTYTVTLTATNASGSSTTTKSVTVAASSGSFTGVVYGSSYKNNGDATWEAFDDDLATALGVSTSTRILQVRHNYIPQTSSWTNYKTTVARSNGVASYNADGTLANATGGKGVHTMLNIKCGWASAAAGSQNANFASLVSSVPSDGKTLWLILNHEPENDTGAGTAAQWRAGIAQFAKTVIDNRGSKDIRPGFCLMADTFNNASKNPDQWNPAAELAALGVSLAEVVFACDGYSQDPSPTGRQPIDVFKKPFDTVKSWGFSRLAIGETACQSHDGTAATYAKTWVDNLKTMCHTTYQLETCGWFNSDVGTNAGTWGWFMYQTNQMKSYAQGCLSG